MKQNTSRNDGAINLERVDIAKQITAIKTYARPILTVYKMVPIVQSIIVNP